MNKKNAVFSIKIFTEILITDILVTIFGHFCNFWVHSYAEAWKFGCNFFALNMENDEANNCFQCLKSMHCRSCLHWNHILPACYTAVWMQWWTHDTDQLLITSYTAQAVRFILWTQLDTFFGAILFSPVKTKLVCKWLKWFVYGKKAYLCMVSTFMSCVQLKLDFKSLQAKKLWNKVLKIWSVG